VAARWGVGRQCSVWARAVSATYNA
jgi:hypothetical protein